MNLRKSAFTLIELLIVVAIIAILAAIAVPNLLEAQVRSKVSRVKADQRTYATAIEAYYVDYNEYPPVILFPFSVIEPLENRLVPLSTPVSYMSDALIPEPFNGRQGWILYRGWDVLGLGFPPDGVRAANQPIYLYLAMENAFEENATNICTLLAAFAGGLGLNLGDSACWDLLGKRWWVISPGPDTFFTFDQALIQTNDDTLAIIEQITRTSLIEFNGVYDPTNGTVSRGEIVRTRSGIWGEKK